MSSELVIKKNRPMTVVAALPAEVRALIRRAKAQVLHRENGVALRGGHMCGERLIVATTGDGVAQAEEGIGQVLQTYHPTILLVVGTSGGLSPELGPGQIVVATSVGDEEGFKDVAKSIWLDAFLRHPDVVEGRVYSSKDIVGTAEEKARLLERLSQDGDKRPLVVDLESHTISRYIHDLQLPYVVIRAVSDTAAEDLPLDFNKLRDERGRVSRVRVLARALLRPGLFPQLRALRDRVVLCSQRLAELIEDVVYG